MYYRNSKIVNLNRIFDQNSRQGYLRLDLNENPGGLPDDFISNTLREINPEFLSEYPETLQFTETLAAHLGVKVENICLVNGSAEGIRYILEAFTCENGKVVGVVPTYAMFEVYCKMYGRYFERIPYTDDLKMPVGHILEHLNKDVQLLILLNPNNPMGNAYTEEEFKQILSKAQKEEITVLIDEAYYYFYEKSFLKYALMYENVFVTRTFSKLFSLAGARLGYVVGCQNGIELVQKLCTPHNVNAFAQLFARKIIETPGMIEQLVHKYKEGRKYLEEMLQKNSYLYHGEYGNFIFIKPKSNVRSLIEQMKEKKGILIKSYADVGILGDCLRVTTGEKKYMERFVDALLELDSI